MLGNLDRICTGMGGRAGREDLGSGRGFILRRVLGGRRICDVRGELRVVGINDRQEVGIVLELGIWGGWRRTYAEEWGRFTLGGGI